MTEIRSYEQANEYLGKKNSRPLRYKTRVERLLSEAIAIRHHDTDIIVYKPNGTVIIDTQGWHTKTTKDRLNNHLPGLLRVVQEDSVWYLRRATEWVQWVFADGMRILPDGTVEGAGPPAKELKKLNKEILKYSRNYIKALFAGEVEKPGPGDCWYCMFTSKEVSMGDDHLRSHLEENYQVPSLLVRAIEVFPVSKWAMWALGELWGQTDERTHSFGDDLAKHQLRSSLKRYLRRQLGLAS